MDMSNHGHHLGIEIIDSDHREISELLAEINVHAGKEGEADRKIRRLRDLARLTRSHFLLEEWMMGAANYPGLAVHRMRHAWMLEEIGRLAEYWGKQKNALARESHIAHLEGEDRAYGLWLDGMCSESERDRAFYAMNR